MTPTRRDFIWAGLALAAAPIAQVQAKGLAGAACTRVKGEQLHISWTGPAADVRVSNNPEGPFTALLARGARDGWTGDVPVSPRPYFRLNSPAGATEIAERVLPLQGGRRGPGLREYGGGFGARVWGVE